MPVCQLIITNIRRRFGRAVAGRDCVQHQTRAVPVQAATADKAQQLPAMPFICRTLSSPGVW
jgi:hypothetical protein